MESAVLIYLLLAAVIILPLVGIFLKRKARAAGTRRGEEKKERQASGDLGSTITLAADEATTRGIVSPILESTKRVRVHPDGGWAHTHYNDDDVLYELVDVPGGTTLAISRAIEFAGTLNGMKQWQKLREQIRTAASDRGITATEGTRPLVRTAETSPSGAVIWRATA